VVQSVKRHWKVDRRIDTSLVDDDVRDIEFLLHSPINLLKESVTIANDVERNKELQYIMSITSAVLIYLAILIISPFVTANVRLPISSVSYNIPTNLQRINTSFSFNQFIYRKAYPYTLYEAYDSKGQQAAVFVVPQEAVKWAQEFPDYTVYKVVYDQTKMLSKNILQVRKLTSQRLQQLLQFQLLLLLLLFLFNRRLLLPLLPLLIVLQQERKQVASSLCLNVQN